jgi:16S rRNA (cytidine1402-2'-O)-methyltransferase
MTGKTYHIGAHAFPAASLAPALYIVPTPIGNLGDITLRALQVLSGVDIIACEDTRVTVKLLERYAIKNPLRAYHDHNATEAGKSLMYEIASGKSVALVSDAGTPLLSDPGFPLVRDCIEANIKVEALPGASALLPALLLSGQPTDRFTFLGFLPQKKTERLKFLSDIAERAETVAVYESPYRVLDTLEDMVTVLGDRPISVSREVSKLHEESLHGTSSMVRASLQAKTVIKGEFVIIIGAQPIAAEEFTDDDIATAITQALQDHPSGKAASLVSKKLGISRDDIYARILAIKGKT